MAQRRTKGEGSIYFNERMDRWVAQITLPNGKRKSKVGRTQKEVSDWLLVQRNSLHQGIYTESDNLKLGDFLESYLENVTAHNVRPRTFERHSSIVNKHINPELGNMKLTALRPEHVQALYSLKLREGLSARTVEYIHAVLHKALNQAMKWGLVMRNVTDLVEKPRPKKKTFTTWSVAELKQFLDTVRSHRWHTLYVLAAHTGLRQGEVLGIHREDIDLERGIIHVRHQVSAIVGQGLTITEPKTEKARRPVTLPPSALETLRSYLDDTEVTAGLIFTTSTGKPVSPRNVLRHFKRAIPKAGVPDIRFHDLRHTHATLLLQAGVHPKVVQERLGHSQISLTLDTYSHVIPSMQTEAADQFEALFN